MTSSRRNSDSRARRRHEDDSRSRSWSYERRQRYRRSRSRTPVRYRRKSRSLDRGRSAHQRSAGSSCRPRIRVDSPSPCHCLGVFGLSVYTTEPYLNDIFCRFGKVEKCIVIYDPKTRLSRGFGFIYYSTVEEATLARTNCNGLEIHGRRIRVDFSITDQPHSPTPGVYMGRQDESCPSSPRSSCRKRYHHRSRRSYSRSPYDTY